MAFVVKENRNFKDTMEDIKYLNEIGVRDIYGKTIERIYDIIIDKEKNMFLLCVGMTNPNRDGGDYPIYYYSFCKDGMVYDLKVKNKHKGSVSEKNIEEQYIVIIEKIPSEIDWYKYKSEICEYIKQAFVVEGYNSYGKRVTKDYFKSVVVEIFEKGSEK